MLFFDVKGHGQPPNKLLKVCDPLGFCLVGVFIRRGKQRTYIFNDLLLPLGDLVFAEVVSPTQFCLRTFTAKCLKNNFPFKLGSEGSSFSFRHRISPFSKIVFYHNLGLEGGLNFRWQYTKQFFEIYRNCREFHNNCCTESAVFGKYKEVIGDENFVLEVCELG